MKKSFNFIKCGDFLAEIWTPISFITNDLSSYGWSGTYNLPGYFSRNLTNTEKHEVDYVSSFWDPPTATVTTQGSYLPKFLCTNYIQKKSWTTDLKNWNIKSDTFTYTKTYSFRHGLIHQYYDTVVDLSPQLFRTRVNLLPAYQAYSPFMKIELDIWDNTMPSTWSLRVANNTTWIPYFGNKNQIKVRFSSRSEYGYKSSDPTYYYTNTSGQYVSIDTTRTTRQELENITHTIGESDDGLHRHYLNIAHSVNQDPFLSITSSATGVNSTNQYYLTLTVQNTSSQGVNINFFTNFVDKEWARWHRNAHVGSKPGISIVHINSHSSTSFSIRNTTNAMPTTGWCSIWYEQKGTIYNTICYADGSSRQSYRLINSGLIDAGLSVPHNGLIKREGDFWVFGAKPTLSGTGKDIHCFVRGRNTDSSNQQSETRIPNYIYGGKVWVNSKKEYVFTAKIPASQFSGITWDQKGRLSETIGLVWVLVNSDTKRDDNPVCVLTLHNGIQL